MNTIITVPVRTIDPRPLTTVELAVFEALGTSTKPAVSFTGRIVFSPAKFSPATVSQLLRKSTSS
jgi:hypothetical protein